MCVVLRVFVCLLACLFVCLLACLFACLCVCLLVCLFVCLLVCLFVSHISSPRVTFLRNLDPLTETYNMSFYLHYLAQWPEYMTVAESSSGNLMGYSK